MGKGGGRTLGSPVIVGLPVCLRLVQGNDFSAEQVVPSLERGWDLDRVFALVGDQLVDGPDAVFKAVVGDLGPLPVRGGLDVHQHRSLVGGVYDVVGMGVVVPVSIPYQKRESQADVGSTTNHSNVNMSPAFALIQVPTEVSATLHLSAELVTSLTGLLLGGDRIYFPRPSPWSFPLAQTE